MASVVGQTRRARSGAQGEIASFKVPKRVWFADELPRKSMGMAQKAVLRKRFAARA